MGDQVIVELTTLMVFNGSMHGLPLVTHEAPVRSGLILAPFFCFFSRNEHTFLWKKHNPFKS